MVNLTSKAEWSLQGRTKRNERREIRYRLIEHCNVRSGRDKLLECSFPFSSCNSELLLVFSYLLESESIILLSSIVFNLSNLLQVVSEPSNIWGLRR